MSAFSKFSLTILDPGEDKQFNYDVLRLGDVMYPKSTGLETLLDNLWRLSHL